MQRQTADAVFDKALMGPNGCWIYRGVVEKNGYPARVSVNMIKKAPYTWAYEEVWGALAPGLQIDHLCGTRRCINPDHLEAVTPKVNTLRSNNPAALNARKTHCSQGHAFDGVNSRGARTCRVCTNARARARKKG